MECDTKCGEIPLFKLLDSIPQLHTDGALITGLKNPFSSSISYSQKEKKDLSESKFLISCPKLVRRLHVKVKKTKTTSEPIS